MAQVTLVDHWQQKRGYRLPTRIEHQLATLAGCDGPFSCGDADDELLAQHATYVRNSYAQGGQRLSPVATRKPNDFGLFDMHGNVREFSNESESNGLNGTVRFAMGGSFLMVHKSQRVTQPGTYMPADGSAVDRGFRIVRLLP